MLSLKQGLSLSTKKALGGWTPTDEGTLEGWYQNKIGITLNGSDVSQWSDSSTNGRDMVQNTSTEQPAYNLATGALTFASGNDTNLQTTSQISISGDFTLGIRMKPTSNNGTFIADNTAANELFKISSSTQITIKIDGGTAVIGLDSGSFGDDYIVLSRVSNGFILYRNGVLQSTTQTLSGTIDIDAIGIREEDRNGFDGDIKEIQIYSSTSQTLISNINSRLSLL
jgi:activator of 2-hydroxyglutaryl-CoA dehydratase